ncbi:hypothetical protein EVAR_7000_1 [Eumeta japonica]|uniref:Uncharacterized protein n=1 Tax=Eumeta variegata TaxID=151549 RepID=A0A4C1THR5_EUMVA|nr:hypothetical protein EVAR_7000_1 [Eumeta japonica]
MGFAIANIIPFWSLVCAYAQEEEMEAIASPPESLPGHFIFAYFEIVIENVTACLQEPLLIHHRMPGSKPNIAAAPGRGHVGRAGGARGARMTIVFDVFNNGQTDRLSEKEMRKVGRESHNAVHVSPSAYMEMDVCRRCVKHPTIFLLRLRALGSYAGPMRVGAVVDATTGSGTDCLTYYPKHFSLS